MKRCVAWALYLHWYQQEFRYKQLLFVAKQVKSRSNPVVINEERLAEQCLEQTVLLDNATRILKSGMGIDFVLGEF